MYSDKGKSLLPVILLILILAFAISAGLGVRRTSREDLKAESAGAIRSAVEKSARQCYVVEGVYPSNLKYLEDNYGLTVNTRSFYITYDAFASNLPPTVTVTPK